MILVLEEPWDSWGLRAVVGTAVLQSLLQHQALSRSLMQLNIQQRKYQQRDRDVKILETSHRVLKRFI